MQCPARGVLETVAKHWCLRDGAMVQPCSAGMLIAMCGMQVRLVEPRKMKSLGKGNTLQSRQRLVHSLVHIESWAVDLSW